MSPVGKTSGTACGGRRPAAGPRRSRLGARKTAKPRAGPRKKKLSRLRKPEDMSLEAWQVALRREFGREQRFRLKNVGNEPIFSEFEVTNPETKRTLSRRDPRPGGCENYCSCPDFTVNTLGTCKHVEFMLGRLAKQPGGKRRWRWASSRRTRRSISSTGRNARSSFGPEPRCPAAFQTYAQRYFDAQGRLLEPPTPAFRSS